MKECTIKLDLSEFATKKDLEALTEKFATKEDLKLYATKKDFLNLEDSFNKFAKLVLEALGKVATKEDILRLEKNHGTRIEILEDEVVSINKKLNHVYP